MRRWRRRGFVAGALVAPAGLAGFARPALAQEAWAPLRRPGTAALIRHALAPGTGDPADLTLGDCSTQRNLDARGRAQARAIGAAIRANGITFDAVLTSEWCRCRETAELMAVGNVEAFSALNSFFRDRSTAEAQTAEVRRYLRALAPDARVALVTHQVNIRALTGRFARSGEVVAIDHTDRDLPVLGEVLIPA